MTTNNALITRSDIDQIIRCNAHAGRASWIKHPRSKVLAAAMLREEDFQPAQIPFVGFYESSISAVFDDAVNSELDRYKDEGGCGLTDEELEDCVRGCTISKADAAEIARAWVDRYEDYLSDAANDLADENDQQDQIRLHFASYNSEANAHGYWPWGDEERPVAYISKADLRRLRKLAAQARSAGAGWLLRRHLRSLRLRRVRPQAIRACKRLGSFLLRGRAPLGSGHDVECGTNRRPSRFHLSRPSFN